MGLLYWVTGWKNAKGPTWWKIKVKKAKYEEKEWKQINKQAEMRKKKR